MLKTDKGKYKVLAPAIATAAFVSGMLFYDNITSAIKTARPLLTQENTLEQRITSDPVYNNIKLLTKTYYEVHKDEI